MSNTLGLQVVGDGAVPRIFTGRARTIISGGDFVVVSGAANGVGSGASSFATSDIVVDILQNSEYCNGIATRTVGSNELATFATRGAFLVRAGGIVSGGQAIIPLSGTLASIGPQNISTIGSDAGTTIGRAITASASGTALYALAHLGGNL